MLIYVTAARRLHRPLQGEAALAAAGLVELLLRPWSPSLLGWCLSYAATLGLLRISKLISRRRLILFALAAPIVAQLATLPWALSAFGQISRVAVPANLLVAPVFGVFMLAGVGLVLISLLLPPLAPAALSILTVASHLFGLLLQLMNRFAPEPWGHPGLGGWSWTAAMVISAVMLLPDLPLRVWARGCVAVGLLVAAHVPTMLAAELTWTTLDVGQGDAAVLRADRSHWLVVDAGPAGFGHAAGERVVLPYLERRNARGVSLLLSHGHLDHYGGTSSLLESGRIDRLVLAASERNREWTLPLLAEAEATACELVWLARGDMLTVGELKLHCLWPEQDGDDFGSNDRSLVLRGGPVGREILITGDLELEGELALLAQHDSISATVLKVAHHGSETGTSEQFLNRLGGRWALISCGVGNRYGHPGPATMGRLERAGWELLRTDERGAIRLRWRPSAIELSSARRSP
jgi:competence protein ComEC